MATFNVGDRVRRLNDFGSWDSDITVNDGEIYEVSGVCTFGNLELVGKRPGFTYTAKHFELVTEGNTNTVSKNVNDNIIRLLSTVAVISSATFAKQNATKQTEILALASGKSVLFVDNFTKLADTRRLAERLLAGEDVVMELEFNSITLSDDERTAINAVRPVLEKLNALKGSGYDWLPDAELDAAVARMRLRETSITRNGHDVTKTQAKRVWDKVAPWYAGGPKPTNFRPTLDGYTRDITFNANDMTMNIGCQTCITRAEVEAIARHFKFEGPSA